MDESEEYEPIGLVIPFATCRLCVAGEVFVLKLYPGNISDISKAVLAHISQLLLHPRNLLRKRRFRENDSSDESIRSAREAGGRRG